MMQALERAAAVFCTACICAELLSRFVGQGWGQKFWHRRQKNSPVRSKNAVSARRVFRSG